MRRAPGTHPLPAFRAIRVAREFGLDLSDSVPRGYDVLTRIPELVISVCERAREAGLPVDVPTLHWSVPDPVASGTPRCSPLRILGIAASSAGRVAVEPLALCPQRR